MTRLLIYSLYSSLTLALMWTVWSVTMKRCNNPRLNRLLLIGSCILTLAIPFMLFTGAASSAGTVEIEIPEISVALQAKELQPSGPAILPAAILFYEIGGFLALIYILTGITRLLVLRRRSEKVTLPSGTSVRLIDTDHSSPFTFMGEIYMTASSIAGDEIELVLAHERAHVVLHHWIDLMLMQAVCILQWYNPAAWMMLAELKRIHEYEADSRVLGSGIDRKSYQHLLLSHALAPERYYMTNNFNHSLKNRFIMMTTSPSSTRRALRALALLPAAGIAFFVSILPWSRALAADTVSSYASESSSATTETEIIPADENIYETVEQLPEFPGGLPAMMQYLGNNIKYPNEAVKAGVEGRVVVKFVVNSRGKVCDPSIVKGVSPELDREALRVVAAMPDFKPGLHDGKSVSVWFTLPVIFKLQNDSPATIRQKAPAVMVDGQPFSGSVSDIDSERIEKVEVIKNDPAYPDGKVMITLKK